LKVVVVGAGVAGASAARQALRLGHEVLVLEATKKVGGLLQTEETDTPFGRYVVDSSGGHWLHLQAEPHVRDVLEELRPGHWQEVDRKSACLLDGRPIPYPVQRNLAGADPAVVADYVRTLVTNELRPPREPATFDRFLRTYFGHELYVRFLGPYNDKVWRRPLTELSPFTQRVPVVSLEEVVRGVMGLDEGEVGYNASFVYPRTGGVVTLIDALLEGIPVLTGQRVERVDVERREVQTADRLIAYDRLVWSGPVTDLAAGLRCRPQRGEDQHRIREVRTHVEGLRPVALQVVAIGQLDEGTRGPLADLDPKVQWLYLPDRTLKIHRVGWASRVVPYLAPPDCESLYVEFGARTAHECLDMPTVLAELARIGVRREDQPVHLYQSRWFSHAYPLTEVDTPQRMAVVRAILDESGWGIGLAGRFGRWVYDSAHESVADSFRLVEQLTEVPVAV
jgi:protoporphyrinogen oxidase